MSAEFEKVRDTWRQLGKDDPFWAVASHDDKRGGKWNPKEFFQSGELEVQRAADLVGRHAHCIEPYEHVLDFGSGLGRLSQAWSHRARQVTGVDISAPMIQRARSLHSDIPHMEFVLNEKDDLSCFDDDTFDLVFSLICLQHMPWPLARKYVQEFSRVCRPGGIVAFQLPSRPLTRNRFAAWRQTVVEGLPFGLGRVYRRWRWGTAAAFRMYYTPAIEVRDAALGTCLDLIHAEPDASAGPRVESFFYIFRKPAAS